jgi:riboflavin synthase
MFAGIVEAKCRVQRAVQRSDVLELHLSRPAEFLDISPGDSISCNGVCLTLEAFDADSMRFAAGPETLRLTGWSTALVDRSLNVERSLRWGDRVHGHFVTGHADGVARVASIEPGPETTRLTVEVSDQQLPFVWRKGSLALNGVSLTINEVHGHLVSVWLIPETLKRTNLGEARTADLLLIEVDAYARAMVQAYRSRERSYVEDRI